MGTRADFYVGRGKDAEWIGSIAWDGYVDGIPETLLGCRHETSYRAQVLAFLKSREDATFPAQGWPWPWNDSSTTDCVYAFDEGQVWCESQRVWVTVEQEEADLEEPPEGATPCVFPDMSDRKNVTFGERSGLMVFGG